MVIVMPAGHTAQTSGLTGAPGSQDDFVEEFSADIMPYAESHYRVQTDRQHRAIAGLSMGGTQTLGIAIPHLEQFAYIGVFSSGLIGGLLPGSAAGSAAHRPSPTTASPRQLGRATSGATRQRRGEEGFEAGVVQHGVGRPADHDVAQYGGSAEGAWLQCAIQREPRRAHLDQLAELPERVRAAVVPVTSLCAIYPSRIGNPELEYSHSGPR